MNKIAPRAEKSELSKLWYSLTDDSLNESQFAQMQMKFLDAFELDVQLQILWTIWDINGDGFLEFSEMQEAIKKFDLGDDDDTAAVCETSLKTKINLTRLRLFYYARKQKRRAEWVSSCSTSSLQITYTNTLKRFFWIPSRNEKDG